jgi:hypothetical protein
MDCIRSREDKVIYFVYLCTLKIIINDEHYLNYSCNWGY